MSEQKTRVNYQDYASGRVLYGTSGATNFPIRLSNEIFEWCDAYLTKKNSTMTYTMYDPFCGIAYTLTVLGFLYSSKINALLGSDIDPKLIEFATKNLSLLTSHGLNNRMQELQKFIDDYGKDSHREALQSAFNLQATMPQEIRTKVFPLNILEAKISFPEDVRDVNFVFTDLPYGELTNYQQHQENSNPIQTFLDNIKTILSDVAIVAVVVNKKQTFSYDGYTKIKTFKRGTRKVIVLEPL